MTINEITDRKIAHHEDWQGEDVFTFLATRMVNGPAGVPPRLVPENVNGTIPAVVDDSRWIVRCPNEGCGGAVLVSEAEPFFICPECASVENGRRWYAVTYPSNKAAIESALLDRPRRAIVGQVSVGRGWIPTQTIEDLRDENNIIEAAAGNEGRP